MTDMEGISGVVNASQVATDSSAYQEARHLLAGDVNAAIAGALDAGATTVTVSDGHARGFNLPIKHMDARATYERPCTGLNLMPAMSAETDALFAVGMHAMSGTPHAFLEHTQSSATWHRYSIDGVECGEIAQCAYYAGAYGVPLVLVSGDLAAAEEARRLVPETQAIAVKEALGRESCRSLSPESAHELIRAGARKALSQVSDVAPCVLSFPVEVSLEFNRCSSADAFKRRPGYARLDGFTIAWTAEDQRQLLPF